MSGGEETVLASLVADLVDRVGRGETVDLAGLLQQHPEWADDLRELWLTVQVAEDLADEMRTEIPGLSLGDRGKGRAGGDGPDLNRASLRPAALSLPRQFGDYELLEELGRGGMGIVYKARQRTLDRIVALKMILRHDLASPDDLRRFRAEAEAAARLDHPNIVPVYEVGDCAGTPYFSMKYIAGTTLSRLLADGPLNARRTAELLAPIARAVAAAHARGVLHRDLKPSNILVDPEGVPHVTDFGLAKRIPACEVVAAPGLEARGRIPARDADAISWLTQTGAILGTPAYMSPEQASGRRGLIGPPTDIYSLGTILYHCLTGRPPFQAASQLDVLLMVLEQDPVLPRVVDPHIDADLEMIALKCLQKPAELRYASAQALADDLRAWLANEPISARSTNLGQLMSRMLRETHHAGLLENWGVLWMWHSLVLLVLCVATNLLQWLPVTDRIPYLCLWVLGLGTWAVIFWGLRRRAGPITFVERQVAHLWAASMMSTSLLFWIETLLGFPVLTLSPVLPLAAGTVFLVKAGILSGSFYIQAVVLFATSVVMAFIRREGWPDLGLTLYGVVSAACFFFPGLKYYRQRLKLSA